MEGPNSSSPTIYPPYLFRHSPTYSSWARLTAADVHNRLQQEYPSCGLRVKDLWYFANHPIRWVRIVGIVVAFEEWDKRVQITVDDGSGEVIEATAWKPSSPSAEPQAQTTTTTTTTTPPPNLTGVRVHAVVKVKGTINEFRGRKQMLLRKVEVLRDTADEVQCWQEMVAWKRTVLMQPWVVDQETARKEERAWAKEERRRLKQARTIDAAADDDGRVRKRVRRVEDGKNQYRGRRRPEGYVPPPRTAAAAAAAAAAGEVEDTSAQQPSWFRGRRRPADYVPPPRPPASGAGPTRAADDYSDLTFGVELKATAAASARDAKDGSARLVEERKMLDGDFSDLDFGGRRQPPGQRRSARSRVREVQNEIGLSQAEFVVSTSTNGDALHPSKNKPLPPSCRDHHRWSVPAPSRPSTPGSLSALPRTKDRDSKPASVEHDACTLQARPALPRAHNSSAGQRAPPRQPPPSRPQHTGRIPSTCYPTPTQPAKPPPSPSPPPPPPTRPRYIGGIPSTISTYHPSPAQSAKPPPPPPQTRSQYIGGIPSTISTYYPSPTQSAEPLPLRPEYAVGFPSSTSTQSAKPALRSRRRSPPSLP